MKPARSDGRPRRARIVIDGSSITAEASGARTRLIHLLSAYGRLERRHDLTLLCTRASGVADRLAPIGLDVEVVPPPPGPLGRLLRSSSAQRSLLRRVGADVLQVETLPVPGSAGIPMILTIHDLRDLEPSLTAPWRPRALYARHVLPRALRRVASVVAVSHDTARRVAALSATCPPVDVVPNAPDPTLAATRPDPSAIAHFRERFAIEGRYMLALGHVEPRKGLRTLVEAMGQLRAREGFGDVTLLIVGRDLVGEGDRLRHLARSRSVPIVLTGSVDDATRVVALRGAACVAVPSRVEGFGIVPLEAMSVGIPVVAARSTAIPEVVGDAAELVEPGDAAALAGAIERVLREPAYRDDLVRRGLDRVAAFSWEASARALRDVHDRVAPIG